MALSPQPAEGQVLQSEALICHTEGSDGEFVLQ